MDRIKELLEAKEAANEVIDSIDNATSYLNSARTWGKWDIFAGGFITSLLKRNKINKANQYIYGISESLENLNKELADVNMTLPESVRDSISDRALDMWFDNIFTDLRVQGEIKESLRQLAVFRESILDLIKRLDLEIEKLGK
ncbi:hypothetical protein [Lagierella sp.]|uniref:hypothetical protein n=1 Tax=Lagierella sp. TaxID=2849657 RepID=UPI002604F48D|nr:hypothetical protein [Lagierella sp.]